MVEWEVRVTRLKNEPAAMQKKAKRSFELWEISCDDSFHDTFEGPRKGFPKMDYGWHMLSSCWSRVNKLNCHFDVTFFTPPSGDNMRNDKRKEENNLIICCSSCDHFLSSFKVNCVCTTWSDVEDESVHWKEKCLHSHFDPVKSSETMRSDSSGRPSEHRFSCKDKVQSHIWCSKSVKD